MELGSRFEPIAERVVVATLEATLLALTFPGFDQVL
jgi:hypothetical protein